MKLPNAEHPITIERNPRRVVVKFNELTVADTTRALTLREATLAPVQYIPREDVDMALLERTAHASYCPYKGDAAYYNLRSGERLSANAVWSYETPYDAVGAIKEHLAFYPSRVDNIEERAA
jgi:uncharacterized protein (DUF427 family)